MKRKYILTLVIVLAALGLGRASALHGNNKISTTPAKDIAGAHAPDAKRNSDPAPSVNEPLPARLTGISIRSPGVGNGTLIEVLTSRPAAYRVLHLENPNRVVLDLEDARNSTHRWKYSSSSPLMARVRVGRFSPQHGGTIRIVADLQGSPAYSVDREPDGFLIELKPRQGKSQAGVSGRTTAARPVKPVQTSLPVSHAKIVETCAQAPAGKAEEKPATRISTVALRRDSEPGSASGTTPSTEVSNFVSRPKREKKQEFPEAAQAT